MIKNYKNYFLLLLILFSLTGFLCFTVLICLPAIKESPVFSTSTHHTRISYPSEKRGSPTYDSIIGDDKLTHYRVFFWVPKTATSFVPYADEGVKQMFLLMDQ